MHHRITILFFIYLLIDTVLSSTCDQIESGTDRWGNDIARGFPTNGYKGCCSACDQTPTCQAWTFVPLESKSTSKGCWLKFAVPPIRTPSGNPCDALCVSGHITVPSKCSDESQWEFHTDRMGLDIQHFDTEDAGFCCTSCQVNSQCVAWTYVKTTNSCWLKNGVPPINKESPCGAACISGVKTCPPGDELDIKEYATPIIIAHEAFSETCYLDTNNNPTIGFGLLLDTKGKELLKRLFNFDDSQINAISTNRLNLTEDQAKSVLQEYNKNGPRELQSLIPNYFQLPLPVQAVLMDMWYNLGFPRMKKFERMIQCLESNDLECAVQEIHDSTWYHGKTHHRAAFDMNVVQRYKLWCGAKLGVERAGKAPRVPLCSRDGYVEPQAHHLINTP